MAASTHTDAEPEVTMGTMKAYEQAAVHGTSISDNIGPAAGQPVFTLYEAQFNIRGTADANWYLSFEAANPKVLGWNL
ncbi:hypothetical protein MGYG_05363 [Nannizzia gypsea CBS 118893]|uniref:Uncharacterized protein n=1 Tax=Arthroderma gypseum (strain ATCC MYA-4604 / CBS 118893) TaxID=535722 RepID=E4UVP0_ARTGP|nr:hypothetical protein MGYG_05363 [Nannizzia gypsea CBS 118893]EFR02367.1 hypothetical protein MGYG_05363 [Nannizzia gypsea CBS 118893]